MKHLLLLVLVAITACQGNGRVVRGIFTVDGIPRPGVQVYLPSDVHDFTTCSSARLSATTNNAGEFNTRATGFPIRPCFVVDGVTFSTFSIVDDGTRKPIELKCELPLVVTGHFEDGHICYGRRR